MLGRQDDAALVQPQSLDAVGVPVVHHVAEFILKNAGLIEYALSIGMQVELAARAKRHVL